MANTATANVIQGKTANKTRSSAQPPIDSFVMKYKAGSLDKIQMVRSGVSPEELLMTAREMSVSNEKLFSLLGLPRTTINRRIKNNTPLPSEQSERVIGLQRLIGQVETMVVESGGATGFHAARWLAEWLEQPLLALNNAQPSAYMDTVEGIDLVSSLLAQIQSGAYA